MKGWYRFQAKADDPSVVDIHIIDFIGDWYDDAGNRFWGETIGVTARAFVEELSKLPAAAKTLRVHINSPGGDVQGGINIANALREQTTKGRTVETIIDGLAASVASVIAMAGSTVTMGDNALMMIHAPWTIEIGNAAQLRKTADILDTMRGQIVATYRWHSSLKDEEIVALIEAETWLNADEAIEHGFATHKVEGLKAAAAIDRRVTAKLAVPDKYRARFEALLAPVPPAPPSAAAATEVLRVCREGGCLELAEALIAENATLDKVQTRVTEAKNARVAAEARVTQIRALCTQAKHADLADDYIAGGMSVENVRAQLALITAKVDNVEIDGGLNPDTKKPKAAGSVFDFYGPNRTRTKE